MGELIEQEGNQLDQKAMHLEGAFDRLADAMAVAGLYKELRDIKQGPDVPIYLCRMRIVKLKELMKCLAQFLTASASGSGAQGHLYIFNYKPGGNNKRIKMCVKYI